MSIYFQPTRLVGAIALAMGFTSAAFAEDQTTDQIAQLDTIVVTASRKFCFVTGVGGSKIAGTSPRPLFTSLLISFLSILPECAKSTATSMAL